jgi:hypothetical protein
MKTLSKELVEETWQEVALFTPAQSTKEMSKLGKTQPDLLSFVLQFSDELDQEVKELAVYMFFVIYRMFEKGYLKKIKRVYPKEIIKSYEDNEKLLENLEAAHDKFYERIAHVQLSGQPYVIQYVVDTLFEAPEKDDPINLSEDDVGSVFLLLKTAIDILNKKTDN